jgi:Zn-dependent protease with chaperone function
VGRRLLTVVLPILLWQAVGGWQTTIPAVLAPGPGPRIDGLNATPSVFPAVVIGIYVLVTLGWYSRLLEHQADLWACAQLQESGASSQERHAAVATYVSALASLAQSSHAGHRQRGWLHPSLQSRIEFLQSHAKDTIRTNGFQRRVFLADCCLLLAAASPLLLLL